MLIPGLMVTAVLSALGVVLWGVWVAVDRRAVNRRWSRREWVRRLVDHGRTARVNRHAWSRR